MTPRLPFRTLASGATASLLLCVITTAPCSPRHAPARPVARPKAIATVAMLRRRVRLDMTHRAVNRAVHGLTFGRGRAVVQAEPEGYTREMDSYPCADGTVWVDYGMIGPKDKPEAARVEAMGGPHFFIGDASALP